MNNSSNKQEAKAMAKAASRDLTLQNKSKQEASEVDAWRGICSAGCYRAKTEEKKCKCKCQGKLHGKAYAKNIEETEINRIANKSDQE
jgi:hypothetical protein